MSRQPWLTSGFLQNKKRKFNRDRDGRDDLERTPEEPEDPLKDATTLYVGNLYADNAFDWRIYCERVAHGAQVILHDRRTDS